MHRPLLSPNSLAWGSENQAECPRLNFLPSLLTFQQKGDFNKRLSIAGGCGAAPNTDCKARLERGGIREAVRHITSLNRRGEAGLIPQPLFSVLGPVSASCDEVF
jgi:hypothetical protein